MPALVFLFAPLPAGAQADTAGTQPLRKTDLIRLLTNTTMTPAEVAAQVRLRCLAFTPTARDRANLVSLGADSGVMARVDACVRAAALARQPAPPPAAPPTPPPATPAPPARLIAAPLATRVQAMARGTAAVGVALRRGLTPVSGARLVLLGTARLADPAGGGGPDAAAVTDARGLAQFRFPAGDVPGTYRLGVAVEGDSLSAPAEVQLTVVAPPAPAPPAVAAAPVGPAARAVPPANPAAERTGFVLGLAQRGRVGETAPLPVVFEVRDSAGRAIPGIAVSLSAVNGQLVGAQPSTDSLGQVRAQVVFGERAGVATVITARTGAILRQAELYPAAAAPSRLVVLLDGNALVSQVLLLANRTAQLRIFCRDRFGNPVALTGLRAAVGDEHVVRVTEVTADSLGGEVSVAAGKAGSTNLVIQGSGLRADFSALVRP